MVTRTRQVGDGKDLRCMAGGDGNRTRGPLDCGDARGDGIGGGVGQATVDVAGLGERELGGTVRSVIKLERGGGVDGQRRRAGGGIRRQTGMYL